MFSLFARGRFRSLVIHRGPYEVRSDCTDAQADLNLHWSQSEQSDQSLFCSMEKSLHPSLSKNLLREDSDQTAQCAGVNAQTDRNPRRAQMSEGRFSDVAARFTKI